MGLLHYVQLEKEWISSPAASDMADALGLETDALLGKVARLWAWSLDNATPKGIISGRNPERAIEEAANWRGKRGAFVKAAIKEGGILKKIAGNQLLFRGWEKRYGAILAKSAKWAELKKNQRNRGRTSSETSTGMSSRTSTRTSTRTSSRTAPLEIRDQDQDLDQEAASTDERADPALDPDHDHPPPPPTSSVEKQEDEDSDLPDQGGKWNLAHPRQGWGFYVELRAALGVPGEATRPRGWDPWFRATVAQLGEEGMAIAMRVYFDKADAHPRGWPSAHVFMAGDVAVQRATYGRLHGRGRQ